MPGNKRHVATNRTLQLRVNDELVLDAGVCAKTEGPDGPERIAPPETTLFHQVLTYLKDKPDPPRDHPDSRADPEGLAAAAVTLRWGSYLVVLLDPSKPLWPPVHVPTTSRIHDAEMARINIEASAALTEWIDLFRTDRPLFAQLVQRALCYLPMPSFRRTEQLRLRMRHDLGPFLPWQARRLGPSATWPAPAVLNS